MSYFIDKRLGCGRTIGPFQFIGFFLFTHNLFNGFFGKLFFFENDKSEVIVWIKKIPLND